MRLQSENGEVKRFNKDTIPRERLLKLGVNGCRNFNSVPVVRVVVFEKETSVRNFAEISHFVFSFGFEVLDEFLDFSIGSILRFFLPFYVDDFANVRFVLIDEFLVVLSQPFVLDINKFLKLSQCV